MKLYESELKVMEVLWRQGETTAGQMAKILGEEVGWNRNTTYTVIKKCVSKGAVERREPGFGICMCPQNLPAGGSAGGDSGTDRQDVSWLETGVPECVPEKYQAVRGRAQTAEGAN